MLVALPQRGPALDTPYSLYFPWDQTQAEVGLLLRAHHSLAYFSVLSMPKIPFLLRALFL